MQTTLLFLGMMTFQNNMLLGLGIMLAAGEVPRIAQQFGLDSSVRVNMSSVIYSTKSAVNPTRNLNGEMLQSRELGDQFQTTLKEMVQELQTNISGHARSHLGVFFCRQALVMSQLGIFITT